MVNLCEWAEKKRFLLLCSGCDCSCSHAAGEIGNLGMEHGENSLELILSSAESVLIDSDGAIKLRSAMSTTAEIE